MVTRDLPQFLRRLRQLAGLSLRQAQSKSGLARGTISKLENGKLSASPSYLTLLAQAYGVDRNFVLMHAGIVQLPGFEVLMRDVVTITALDDLLQSATLEEKRQLAKYLASLRMTSPLVDEFFDRRSEATP